MRRNRGGLMGMWIGLPMLAVASWLQTNTSDQAIQPEAKQALERMANTYAGTQTFSSTTIATIRLIDEQDKKNPNGQITGHVKYNYQFKRPAKLLLIRSEYNPDFPNVLSYEIRVVCDGRTARSGDHKMNVNQSPAILLEVLPSLGVEEIDTLLDLKFAAGGQARIKEFMQKVENFRVLREESKEKRLVLGGVLKNENKRRVNFEMVIGAEDSLLYSMKIFVPYKIEERNVQFRLEVEYSPKLNPVIEDKVFEG